MILAVPLILAPLMLGGLMKGLAQKNSNSQGKDHQHHDHDKKVNDGGDSAKRPMQINTQVTFNQTNTSSSSKVNYA